MILIPLYEYKYRSGHQLLKIPTFDSSPTHSMIGIIEGPQGTAVVENILKPSRLRVPTAIHGQFQAYSAVDAVRAAKDGEHGLRWRPND